MKLFLSSLSKYEITIFDIKSLLNKLKDSKIKIYHLVRIDTYTYTFYSSIFNKKKLKEQFMQVKFIKNVGLFSKAFSLLKYKTIIVSIIISTLFYINLSNKIWIINIYGDSDVLNEVINQELIDNNIYIGCNKKDVNSLSKIQNKILIENNNIIEYLSISSSGSRLEVSFRKKRLENEKTKYKKSLYAKKDGIIKSFDLLSGEKVVDVNDYVKEGDLLVKDVLTTDFNEQIYIGTYGSVYAYTWYYITLHGNITSYTSDLELLANSLLYVKSNITANFKDNEYIYEENVLQFNIENQKMYLKVHFTCVENIAKEIL